MTYLDSNEKVVVDRDELAMIERAIEFALLKQPCPEYREGYLVVQDRIKSGATIQESEFVSLLHCLEITGHFWRERRYYDLMIRIRKNLNSD